MSYSSVTARHFHKRMSHRFIQAGLTTRYEIKLSTIIRDFGLAEYARPSLNFLQVVKAPDEMKDKEVILNYKVEKTTDPMNRNKLVDAKFALLAHPHFANEINNANARAGIYSKKPNLTIEPVLGRYFLYRTGFVFFARDFHTVE